MILVNTPKLHRFFKGIDKKIKTILCLGIAAASLGACDFDLFSGKNTPQTATNSGVIGAQKPSVSDAGVSFPGQQSALKVPPPLNASSPGNLAALQPPRGINAQRLFAAPLNDEDERFVRVENAVQSIRDEMDGFAPAITRLVAVEKDIQDLVEQLDALLQNEPASGPAALPPASPVVPVTPELPPEDTTEAPLPLAPQVNQEPQKPEPQAQKSSQTDWGSGLRNIRIADNKGYTRIVFETSEKLGRSADLDNVEKILLIDFSKGQNNVDLDSLRIRSSLLRTVSQTPREGGGFTLAFELKASSAILKQGDITPNKDNPNYRYFIDLRR